MEFVGQLSRRAASVEISTMKSFNRGPPAPHFRFRVHSVSSVRFYHYDFLRFLHLESFEFYMHFSQYNFKEGGF